MAGGHLVTTAVKSRRRLLRHMHLVTIAGCLAMVFMACTTSPLTTDFLRDLGGTEFHFGLLSGIPMILLSLQFLGAFVSGKLQKRKGWFMFTLIGGRLMYLPAALLPLLFTRMPPLYGVYIFIGCVAVNSAMNQFGAPLWFSWMGDLIPVRILNRYWAERHRYLLLVWVLSFLAVAVFAFYGDHLATHVMFPILAVIGVAAGVVDIVIFAWVDEPQNVQTGDRHPLEILTEPLRHREYRTMVAFNCAFSAATMLAAGFMQLYVLKVLAIPRWQVNLIWCMVGVGSVLVARMWGRLADRHGHRPILLLCVALKPAICVVFLLVTSANAFAVLTTAFFFDSMLNAGHFIALNGYMMKMAPRENRSMFIAATMALAGIAAGLAAIAGGGLLRYTESLRFVMGGRIWINYHLIFLLSLVARLLCIPLAAAIREPASASTAIVLASIRGLWPMRILTFPTGLLRRVNGPRSNKR